MADWLIFAALVVMMGIDLIKHQHECHCCNLLANEIAEQNALLRTIIRLLGGYPVPRPQSMTLSYTIEGETTMSTVLPIQLEVGQTASPTEQEWSGPNGTGTEVPNAGAVSYAADASGAISVDPNTGIVTAVAPTASGAVATATATDASNPSVLTASVQFTVVPVPVVAESMTLAYTPGPAPAAQTAAARAATAAHPAAAAARVASGPAVKPRN